MTSTLEDAFSGVFTEWMTIEVSSLGGGGEILYRLVMPEELSQLDLAPSRTLANFGEIDLPGLRDRYSDEVHIYSQRSSRTVWFELPPGMEPGGVYELLADYLRDKLKKERLGIKFAHVCPHCGHDATDEF